MCFFLQIAFADKTLVFFGAIHLRIDLVYCVPEYRRLLAETLVSAFRKNTMAPMAWRLLAGKTAAITGGTTGIGRAIALEYIRQGCNVAINHLDLESDAHHKESLLEQAQALRKEGPAGGLIEVAGDVRSPETGRILVEKAVEKWGKLDVFVNNAGVCQFAEFLE